MGYYFKCNDAKFNLIMDSNINAFLILRLFIVRVGKRVMPVSFFIIFVGFKTVSSQKIF